MATYFHNNPDIQGQDGLQTLILMNPSYVQFSDAPQPPHLPPPPPQQPSHNNSLQVFLNSANHTAPPQHFVGIPLASSAAATQDHNNDNMTSHLHGLVPRVHHNFYYPIDLSPQARENIPRSSQGLSLTLSSHQQQHHQAGFGHGPGPAVSGSGEDRSSGSNVTNNNGVSNMQQGVLLSSMYLKAAQELLDEVVNVNDDVIKSELNKKLPKEKSSKMVGSAVATGGEGLTGGEATGKRGQELTTVERQEIQMKKAKLINMLDEVEQRYRQYHHQMQIVISSFEQAAGLGSANAYTSLALQTISKQFRCLKDAITGQIRAANKSLGEEDSQGGKIEGSRLKFVDHHLRQQRALQQLGMIQHNAWRPQRGLPERSVSVLRAWLFEHFLHPYPKDSDKHMLAKQAGLTRSQVSNWFINARVRLWKPMVEEMYLEEIKDREMKESDDKSNRTSTELNEDSASKSVHVQGKTTVTVNQTKTFKSKQDLSISPVSVQLSSAPIGLRQSGFNLTELDGIAQGSPKKPRTAEMLLQSPTGMQEDQQVSMNFIDERQQGRDEYSFMGGPQTNFICGFSQYPMGEIGRFDAEEFTPQFSGNGVSLTLGLPHCENQNFNIPNQNIQLARRVELGEPNHDQFGSINVTSGVPHSSAAYESINIQNRKRFAAQLLPDFVT